MAKDLYSIAFGGRRFLWQVSLDNHETYAIEFAPYHLRNESEIDEFREFFKLLYDHGIKSRVTPLYSVEASADINSLRLRIVAGKDSISAIEKALFTMFDVFALNKIRFENINKAIGSRKLPTKTLRFELKQPFVFPITTYKKSVTLDVLSGLFSVMDTLGKGEHIDLALVLRPFPKIWLEYALAVQRQLKYGEGVMDFLEFLYSGGPLARALNKLLKLIRKPVKKAFTRVPDKYTARMIAQINRKLEDPVGFTFTGYINLQAIDKQSLLELEKRIINAFSRFENPPFNSFVFSNAEFSSFLKRSHPPASLSILNSEEVASLWHFPVGIRIQKVSSRFLEAPVGVVSKVTSVDTFENSDSLETLRDTNTQLGSIKRGGNIYPFDLSSIDVTDSLLIGRGKNRYFRKFLSQLLEFFMDRHYPLLVVDNKEYSILKKVLVNNNMVAKTILLDKEVNVSKMLMGYLPVWLKEQTILNIKVSLKLDVSKVQSVFEKLQTRLSEYIVSDQTVPMFCALRDVTYSKMLFGAMAKSKSIKKYVLLEEDLVNLNSSNPFKMGEFVSSFNNYFVTRLVSPAFIKSISKLDETLNQPDLLFASDRMLYLRPQIDGVIYPFFSVWLSVKNDL